MKINTKQKNLFNLQLLKTKINTKQKKIKNINIKTLELHLKKALHIIYKFHTANKKILFIGTPSKKRNQLKYLLNKTQHTFLPKSIWIDGAISNSSSIIKHLFKRHQLNNIAKKKLDYLFKLNKNHNLIVVFNGTSNHSALKEIFSSRIPIISLNYDSTCLNFNPSTYKILGDFNLEYKKTRNNYFYRLLSNLFKKAEKNKKSIKKTNALKKRWYKNFKNKK
jgi:hypothetical protein